MSCTHLKSLAAFRAKGADVRKFLQGQLTCDIYELSPDKPLKGAHCNREGRVLALYDILEDQDSVVLMTQRALLLEAISVLKHYAMFSKITWEDLSDTHDIYLNAMGQLSIAPIGTVAMDNNEDQYYYQKILHKDVFLTQATVGKFLPQELGLSGAALSFTKGCYLGQEIIARLHYLGKLKRSLQVIKSTQVLKPLDELSVQQEVVGEIVASVKYKEYYHALALVNVSYKGELPEGIS